MIKITDNISYTALLQHKKGNGHRFNAQYEQNNFYTKIFNKKQDLSVSLIANKSVNGQPGFYIEDRPSLTSYRISNRDSVYLQLFKKQTLVASNNIVYSLSMNHFYTNYFDREDTPIEEIQEQTFYNDTSFNLRVEYQKLVSNKWIHARGQEWTRPCGLNENDQSTLIIPGFDRHRSFDYNEVPF